MVSLKRYNLQAEEGPSLEIQENLLKLDVNHGMVKDYIVAIRKNKMQRSSNTKDKSEVKATGKKPHKQKGLGRARQGSLVSPQFKGGGVVFGPKPKRNPLIKINKKEKRLAIKFLISEKIKENRVCILDEFMEKPKTKMFFDFLKKLQINDKRVLVLASRKDNYENVRKSVINIPKKRFMLISNVNGYELALSSNIIALGSAIDEIVDILKGNKNEK